MVEPMKANDVIFLYGITYAKARGFLRIGKFIQKACDRCGQEMIVNCHEHNGQLYADSYEAGFCKSCRANLEEQEKESLKLAMALS